MNHPKLMKVYDCQWGEPKMPDDVKKAFFEIFDLAGNDVFVEYQIADSVYEPGDEWSERRKKLDDWLIATGARGPTDEDSGETVLIKHWW